MGTSDNFCLRWNDFETNISSSFRELRRDSEFFDVTLCCDNGTDRVGAHKVILAACSPFFRRILGHNANTPNPLLYLKGIQKKELQAILNFMYHGEVNVAQESLNAFLSCAEELAVKGLTTDSKPVHASSAQGQAAAAATGNTDGPNIDDDLDFAAPPAQSRVQHKQATPSTSSSAKKTLATRKREADLSLDPEDSKKIKPEPESHLGGPEDAEFGPDDSYGGTGADFDDSYGGGGGYEDMDESGAMEGSELTKEHSEEQEDGPKYDPIHLNEEEALHEKQKDTKGKGKMTKGGGKRKIPRREVNFPVEFVRSHRANTVMLRDPSGYLYSKNKSFNKTEDGREFIYWRCRVAKGLKRKGQKPCPAMATTQAFRIIYLTHQHVHEAVDTCTDGFMDQDLLPPCYPQKRSTQH